MSAANRAAGARRVRALRASRLAALRDSSSTAYEVLQEVPEDLHGISVYAVLTHCPAIGGIKAERLLKCASVWPFTHLNRLTTHEREAILRELPEGDSR